MTMVGEGRGDGGGGTVQGACNTSLSLSLPPLFPPIAPSLCSGFLSLISVATDRKTEKFTLVSVPTTTTRGQWTHNTAAMCCSCLHFTTHAAHTGTMDGLNASHSLMEDENCTVLILHC